MSKEIPLHHQRLKLADKEKSAKEHDREKRLLKQDLAIAFGSPEGRRALAYLASSCGFGKSVVGGNPAVGLDTPHGTIYNAARLNVYLELRSLLPARILVLVEHQTDEWELS